jgi:DNA-binding transcriptional ArsR family regulator
MKTAAPPLLPILRSETQGRLLALLAEDPGKSYGIRELAQLIETSPMTAHREVDRAEQAGLITSDRRGNQRLVSINADHYLYQPLRQIMLATFGVPAVVQKHFSALPGVRMVLIYGSWAARYEGVDGPAPNDVDVLVVSDSVDRDAVDDCAERAERELGIPVQVTIRTQAAWEDASDSFLGTVRSRPFLIVVDQRRRAVGAT